MSKCTSVAELAEVIRWHHEHPHHPPDGHLIQPFEVMAAREIIAKLGLEERN